MNETGTIFRPEMLLLNGAHTEKDTFKQRWKRTCILSFQVRKTEDA